MLSPESSFGASDARGQRYIALGFYKSVLRFTLTDTASRSDATVEEDDDLQTWDCLAIAPTLGSFSRQTMLNNSPVVIARILAALNASNRALVAHTSARGEPYACALEPWTLAFDGGRVLHSRHFHCHDPDTGTTYTANVSTIEGRGQEWLV